jgi:hypothetical protein
MPAHYFERDGDEKKSVAGGKDAWRNEPKN